MRETFDWIKQEFGKLNVLVNVSGIARHKLAIFDDNPENFAQLQQVINTNLTGLVQCSQEAFKIMKSQDDYGVIINMNSVLGHQIPYLEAINLNVYPATKFAVSAITETMRQEIVSMKNKKIRVAVILDSSYIGKGSNNSRILFLFFQSISPGVVETEIRKASGLHSETNDYSAKPRLKPEDISQLVIFILSTPLTVNINDIIVRHIGDPF